MKLLLVNIDSNGKNLRMEILKYPWNEIMDWVVIDEGREVSNIYTSWALYDFR
jgi:hypothetical protein